MLKLAVVCAVMMSLSACNSSTAGGENTPDNTRSDACSGSCNGGGGGLNAEDPMMAEVSDGGGFNGGGGVSVGESITGRYGRISFVSSGRVDEWRLQFRFDLTEAQMRDLAGGASVALSNGEFITYPVSSTDGHPAGVARQIQSIRLALLPGRSMEVTLELGAIVNHQGNPTERPATARARFYGAMPLLCVVITHHLDSQSTVSANDLNFEAPFCRTALRDYGLEPVAQHLGIPVLAP